MTESTMWRALGLIAALGIAIGLTLYWRAQGAETGGGRQPTPAERADYCDNINYWLQAPNGQQEQVPQKFVASAIATRGYHFPPDAERIAVEKSDDYPSDPCRAEWDVSVDKAVEVFQHGAKFRGWRRMTDEERGDAEAQEKFGHAEH